MSKKWLSNAIVLIVISAIGQGLRILANELIKSCRSSDDTNPDGKEAQTQDESTQDQE